MTANERLRHVTSKVERATKHIRDLESEFLAFDRSQPYEIRSTHDPQTRQLVYYIHRINVAIPDSFALIAGDAIQNLMSALDHLAFQLVCSDTEDAPPNANWIYFPIADDAAKYEAKKRGKVEGARQETFDAIDALKPYKGGSDLLWVLYRLNNIEKHRLLFTVGAQTAGVHLGHLMANWAIPEVWPESAREAVESLDMMLVPSDKGFPLRVGDVLYTGDVDEKPNPRQRFAFQIALNEPGVAEGEPLLETLRKMATLVEGIVTALSPRLK